MRTRAGLVMVIVLAAGTHALAATGQATLKGTAKESTITGTAIFTDTPEGLKIAVQVANVPPGQHGLHIHQFGSCDDAGNAAGGHYNPAGTPHGYLPTDGPTHAHAGDFGNLDVGPNGTGTLELVLPDLALTSGPYHVAGLTVILHEKPDDFGQPTGHAGSRIACGPIVLTGE